MYLRSGLRPNPAGGAYSAPPDPVAGGCAPRAPPSLWAFGLKFASGVPQKDMGYVSITTAAKGSVRFPEKAEKISDCSSRTIFYMA